MSKSRDQLLGYLKDISIEAKTVLDVGVQNKPAYKWTQGKAKKYDTVDIDNQWSPTYEFDLNCPLFDVRKYPLHNKYDIVFCLETLEHVWNPVMAMENLIAFTKPGGKIYISTPFVQVQHDTHDYLRFTHQWFEKMADNYDLKCEVRPRVATEGRDDFLRFTQKEGIRMSRVTYDMGLGGTYFDIGYFVKLWK